MWSCRWMSWNRSLTRNGLRPRLLHVRAYILSWNTFAFCIKGLFIESHPCWGQTGKPHPQDPENPRKRLYKVFGRIEESRSDQCSVGSGVHGHADISDNKAHRQAISDVITTKMSTSGVASSLDVLFSGQTSEQQKNKKAKQPKAPKVLSPEEQKKKDFDRSMTQSLNSSLIVNINENQWNHIMEARYGIHNPCCQTLGWPAWLQKPGTLPPTWPPLESRTRRCEMNSLSSRIWTLTSGWLLLGLCELEHLRAWFRPWESAITSWMTSPTSPSPRNWPVVSEPVRIQL